MNVVLGLTEAAVEFLWWVGWWWGGVCKVIFVSNPTTVLRLCCCWGCDHLLKSTKLKDNIWNKESVNNILVLNIPGYIIE